MNSFKHASRLFPFGFLLAFFCLGLFSPAAAETYLTNLPDIPLPDRLSESEEGALVFDKPEGRLIEVRASGSLAPKLVAQFYRDSLPGLGWVMLPIAKDKALRFRRDKEILVIQISENFEGTIVQFQLKPLRQK